MPKRTNLANEAARMARAAASDMASLQRAMREAEDNLAGLHRMLKVPNTTARRSTIKSVRTSQPLLFKTFASTLGGYLASGFSDTGLGDFSSYLPSAGQFAAQITTTSIKGQRIL